MVHIVGLSKNWKNLSERNACLLIALGFFMMLFSALSYHSRPSSGTIENPSHSNKCANGGLIEQTENGLQACKCTRDYQGEYCTEAKLCDPIKTGCKLFGSSLTAFVQKCSVWWNWLRFAFDAQPEDTYTFRRDQIKSLVINSDGVVIVVKRE